ncbi:protein of unknown function (plasmid) [Caballeronia sp. S22]
MIYSNLHTICVSAALIVRSIGPVLINIKQIQECRIIRVTGDTLSHLVAKWISSFA